MRFLFTLLGLVLSLPLLFAQCEEKVTLFGGDFDLLDINRIIRTSDNHFILAGQSNADALIMKVDPCGNVLWEKTYNFGTEQSLRDIIQVGSNFIATGYCEDCRMNDIGKKILVQEFDANGNLVGVAKTLGPSNLDADAYRIRKVSTGGYVIAGTRVITQGNVTGNAMFSYVLNNDLSTKAFQAFGLKTLGEVAYDVVEISGTGFVFVGKSSQTTNPITSQMRVLASNYDLIEIWSQEFFPTNSTKEQAARAIGRLPDGDLIIAGSKLEGSNTQLFVGKLNPLNGALKAQANFGGNGDDFARDLQVINQSEILIGGLREQTGISENPWGIVVDNNLGLVKEYQIGNQGLFNSVLSYMDGGTRNYVFAGTAIGFPSRGILARSINLTTDLDAVTEADALLHVFPNPCKDILNLEGWDFPVDARFRLYRLDGQMVMDLPARQQMNLIGVPSGAYMMQLAWDAGQFSRPLVKVD